MKHKSNNTASVGAGRALRLSGTAENPVRIICPESTGMDELADYLRKFLQARKCFVMQDQSRQVAVGYAGPQLVLTTSDAPGAMQDKTSVVSFAKNSRDEAFVLDVSGEPKNPIVLLAGKALAGTRAAAARFTCVVENDGENLSITERTEEADPFIPLRMLFLGNAARRQAPFGSPFKDADYETWPLERITAYPELFWQFGFNGVQTGEYRGYGVGLYKGYTISADDIARIRTGILTFLKSARSFHLSTSLFQWGDCLFAEGATHSWNDPAEHKIIRDFMKDIVTAYGPYLDHFDIHVGDPGGCTRDGCDHYKTPQQITAAYLEEFRKINPRIKASFSTWANPHFWFHSPVPLDMLNYYWSARDSVAGSPAYCNASNISDYRQMFGVREGVTEYGQAQYGLPVPDGAKFMDAAFMPGDVGIALNRVYNEGQANLISGAGRPVDIWGWYIGDMEMCDTYWISMQSVDKMLGAYPDKARDQVRSQTVELTFHGWPQVINAYVSAQKLWNPRRPLAEIEREFCVAGFGPANAAAVLDLYKACENGVLHPLPRPADFGTHPYNARLAGIIEKAKTIVIPDGWKPNFAFPVDARKLVEMLVARARLILSVSEAKCRIEKARKAGASTAEIEGIKKAAIEAIPNLPIDPIYRQDESIIRPDARTQSFAEIIAAL